MKATVKCVRVATKMPNLTELAHTYGGVPIRQPHPSEVEFFRKSGIPAYAAEDGAVVFSPFVQMSPEQKRSLEMNEAARVWMSRGTLKPNFPLTDFQRMGLEGSHYAKAPEGDRRATIAARLLSGDPSAGTATPEQEAFVKRLRYGMGIR